MATCITGYGSIRLPTLVETSFGSPFAIAIGIIWVFIVRIKAHIAAVGLGSS
ncbi:hypothetical protein CC78DRAFT_538477 [Lojkania enalia]|uniref:Uncharacterized protein n=1 Tax=Lojkania enalia TaxID=147567 RepID=A0A9P4N3W3_9PLEO|nr:hypothetical protein CC78DRAFT_538477 [Didymosphaeria enalia]